MRYTTNADVRLDQGVTTEDYLFDTGSDLGGDHVRLLERLLDGHTKDWLDETGIGRGERCLEIGAGGGSIARWMADRVGPEGRVVTTDVETDRIPEHPGVEVHRGDITEGLPDAGPFDLIHARLVLVHLPQRDRVLAELARALAPGGRLVLGELVDRPLRVLTAPTPADRELFAWMQYLSIDVVSPAGGIAWEWGARVPEAMDAAGLVEIQAVEHTRTASGGGAGCRLHRNLNLQADAALRQAGATGAELARYRDLMLDPRFTAWFYPFTCVRGRRPA